MKQPLNPITSDLTDTAPPAVWRMFVYLFIYLLGFTLQQFDATQIYSLFFNL